MKCLRSIFLYGLYLKLVETDEKEKGCEWGWRNEEDNKTMQVLINWDSRVGIQNRWLQSSFMILVLEGVIIVGVRGQ